MVDIDSNNVIRRGRELLNQVEYDKKQNKETLQSISTTLLRLLDNYDEASLNLLSSSMPKLVDRTFLEKLPNMEYNDVKKFHEEFDEFMTSLLKEVEQAL